MVELFFAFTLIIPEIKPIIAKNIISAKKEVVNNFVWLIIENIICIIKLETTPKIIPFKKPSFPFSEEMQPINSDKTFIN